jgi:CRP/FNR family transcriptional regulator, cyclic AMP receptor protein
MGERLSVEAAFAKVALLSRLSDRQRSKLAADTTRRSYPAGAMIVRQGDTSMSFYVVLDGRARVEREAEGRAGTSVLEELGPGGAFGEMGLIDDMPRAASVIAIEPTECVLLARWDFQNELREDPEIALALLPVLNARIRDLNERLARSESAD